MVQSLKQVPAINDGGRGPASRRGFAAGPGVPSQATIARSQSGSGADFCAGKFVHTMVAPPAA